MICLFFLFVFVFCLWNCFTMMSPKRVDLFPQSVFHFTNSPFSLSVTTHSFLSVSFYFVTVVRSFKKGRNSAGLVVRTDFYLSLQKQPLSLTRFFHLPPYRQIIGSDYSFARLDSIYWLFPMEDEDLALFYSLPLLPFSIPSFFQCRYILFCLARCLFISL